VEHATIPNLDGLTELANRDGVDIKPTLLRVMTDLYVQKPVHSLEEETQYIELAARLIDQVDAATRAIVANRLASYPAAPRAVVERLQRGKTGPAGSQQNPTLPTEPVTSLAELSELFLTADAQDRRLILLHLDYAGLRPAEPVAPQIAQDAIRRLEMAALNHNSEGFAQEIERTLRIDREMARRLIDDESGEPVLVLAHALDMPADVLQRILLCLNPAISHSVLRVYELSMLYDEMEPRAAARLITLWQVTHQPAQRPAQRHQPQHHDDGQDQTALPARPASRWEEHAVRRQEA
jgi:hypothetical protein